MTTGLYISACLRQARPRLSTLLKLMFGEALAFGQNTLWLGSVIELIEPLGFQERTIRTALFRLARHNIISIQRHGRRSACRLTPEAASAVLEARHRLSQPAVRSFDEKWSMVVNTGDISAARFASARKHLLEQEYCLLAPNLLARPASYLAQHEVLDLARFDVSGSQLAAAARQPDVGNDLETPAAMYQQFQQRFLPLRQMLGQRGAFNDEQAYVVRMLVSHAYQHCRRSDPLLPRELLPETWPASAAQQTYVALYNGCATQARRHTITKNQA
ncbi:PaaX family transcriptional regulator C-terminal domain-containing protein [Duganella sp.]|uniref:PaaX family transcriptional regulator C-terminal domain-containing protein n=1 Tax=Duganella sp. TaxID=1904440 RepID=UPI0031E18E90